MITQDFFDTNMQYIDAVGSMYRQTAVVEQDAATPEGDEVSAASVDPEDEIINEPEIVEEDEVVE